MAYTLQALIGDASEVKNAAPSGALVVMLPQGKALVPLTESVRQAHNISFLPLTDGDTDDVPETVAALAVLAKKIAYVEAEFFGGDGTQAAAVWENGKLIFGPVVDNDAINQALRIIGVAKNDHVDEFEALSLSRHRDTDKWI